MTAMQLLHGVPTQNLRAGDIVLCHSMRVRLGTLRTYHGGSYSGRHGTEGRCTQGHGPAGTDSCCVVYSWSGTVLNLDEVRAAGIVPVSWLRTEKWVDGSGWATDRDNQWTVQGNFRATWDIERADS